MNTACSLIDEPDRGRSHKAAEVANGIDQGEAGRDGGAGKKLARHSPKRTHTAAETDLHERQERHGKHGRASCAQERKSQGCGEYWQCRMEFPLQSSIRAA